MMSMCNKYFCHRYEGQAWIEPIISPNTGSGQRGYRMETTVDLKVRPDTRNINSSPVTVIFPVENYHKACTYGLRVSGE